MTHASAGVVENRTRSPIRGDARIAMPGLIRVNDSCMIDEASLGFLPERWLRHIDCGLR